ncbi:molybdate ABC transporter substrate-binding protein [Lacisediminihabitans changchengi]|uniref:Molybdate ABC transporter substrate-binding protein n=1 Tax=Lacisediminihabitans changchengi TaxID=2787634 RepID=A0A934SGT9_9MICO|nr:molybdate ABC transporter substrate-binding protein [Lacisediminihabitans changchengi]MBK4346356.1 molybdate ABC transporter substrate-binding protein [Lacisediminihabitans changchengi]
MLGATACSAPKPAASPSTTATADTLSGSITVFGAASLTKTFTKLAANFQKLHPGVTVATSFAGSADLVTQITAGAPADVFASADTKNMDKLTTASLVEGTPVDFATNVLEIAVPPSNPANITDFADLAKPGVKTVICAPAVPCGAATLTVETATGVKLSPVSEETAVTDVLGKVSSGQADAGLVYVTDVTGAGSSVKGIPFADSSKAVNTYPIAALKASKTPKVAQAFIDYVTGKVGQKVLADAGFGKP